MSSDESGRSSYLDLLITTLMEHEKNLDAMVEKMEKINEELQTIYRKASLKPSETVPQGRKSKQSDTKPETLVYLKINLDRHIDDVMRIIQTLKE